QTLKLESGLAEVRFQCGARVVLDGPATLELLSGRSARLLRGKLSARVPEAAAGFEVLSPQGKVIDRGTEFGVAGGEGGATDVYVFAGKVEPHASGAMDVAVNLTEHQTARIAAGKVTRAPVAAGQFVRAIVPPPVVCPRTLKLTFGKVVESSLLDARGRGTGLTHRLPRTGSRLAEHDAHLRLDPPRRPPALTPT